MYKIKLLFCPCRTIVWENTFTPQKPFKSKSFCAASQHTFSSDLLLVFTWAQIELRKEAQLGVLPLKHKQHWQRDAQLSCKLSL